MQLAKFAGGAVPERCIAVSLHTVMPSSEPGTMSVGWRTTSNVDVGVCLLGGFSEEDVALIWQHEHPILAWGAQQLEEACERGSLGRLRESVACGIVYQHA